MIDKVDFVIPWVNGNDPVHKAKRELHLKNFENLSDKNTEQSTDKKRFIHSNELKYCLRSIVNHAPWYNKIWLVTDNQTPDFIDSKTLNTNKIEIVDHTHIFRNKKKYLPTFNTRAIATQIFEIDGLSEHFIYGNDDFMLSCKVEKEDFFNNERPIVYGEWSKKYKNKSITLHRLGAINSANMIGLSNDNHIVPSHVFQPMRKSIIKLLNAQYPSEFDNNLQHKFRHESQFIIESLINHYLIKNFDQEVISTDKMIHFSFEMCRNGPIEKIKYLFDLLEQGKRNMFCINEFESLAILYPEIKSRLDMICGPALEFER